MVFLAMQSICPAQTVVSNLWKLKLSGQEGDSSPAIAADGTIYQATFDGKLLAVTPQGAVKWMFQAGREIKSSPAIADDGTIYFGARDRKLYAVTPAGKLKWTFPSGAWVDSSPAIAADGTVYFGSWDGNFYAVKADGSKKWVFAVSSIVDSSPAVAADGTIYFGAHDKKFYALKPDGTPRWAFTTGGQIISSPAIGADGTVYFTSTDGNFYALNTDGTEKWRYHVDGVGMTESSPVLDAGGNIYVSANPWNICVGPDGKTLHPPWRRTAWRILPRPGVGWWPSIRKAPKCGKRIPMETSPPHPPSAATERCISGILDIYTRSTRRTGCRR